MLINDQHFTAFTYNTVQCIMLLLSITIYSCPLACIKHSKDEKPLIVSLKWLIAHMTIYNQSIENLSIDVFEMAIAMATTISLLLFQ